VALLRLLASRGVSFAVVLLLCGCGGGGSGSAPPVTATPIPTAQPSATPVPGPGTATFTLTPDSTSSITGRRRSPRYVSPSTASIAIVLGGAGTATYLNLGDPAHCDASQKCSVSIAAAAGNDAFLVSAYSGTNGSGSLLSRATVQALIASSGNSVVPVVLNGDVASMTIGLANVNPMLHHATTDAVTVIAKDAAGSTIVGPGGYLYPIVLADSDTSGHSSLTKTTLNGPGDTTALLYDGGYGSGTLTASALGAAAPAPVSFFPLVATTETPLPAGHTAHEIIVGPDGALWFVDSPLLLGRITTSGALTQYAVPANWNPHSICAGPDGAIWFTAQGTQFAYAAMIRRAPDGTYNVYQVGTPFAVGDCATGPDGNLYANFGSSLLQITPTGTVTTLALQDKSGNSIRVGSPIVGSPDGALWFVDTGYGALDRYDLTTHALTIYLVAVPFGAGGAPVSAVPAGVVLGPDKRFYFIAFFSIYASDTSGNITTVYPETNGVGMSALGFAADASLWSGGGSTLAGMPTFLREFGGSLTPLLGTSAQSGFPFVDSIVSGPDGALWYARGTAIGRIVP